MLVLDSSSLIEIIHDTSLGKRILELVKDEQVAITTLTVFEVVTKYKNDEIQSLSDLLLDYTILDFDYRCAIFSGSIDKRLKSGGRQINVMDILIAGICLSKKLKLITVDNDFKNVEGLDVQIVK